MISPAVMILAAGASRRMGRPKLLLPWKDTTVLGHLIRTWQRLQACQIVVVHPPQADAIAAELNRTASAGVHDLENPTPEHGMFSSILTAARWNGWHPRLTHCLIALGDQPHLREETLRSLLHHAATHPHSICQPAFHGRPKHPVALPFPIFKELESTAAEHLKQFLQERTVTLCPCDDPGLDLDVDTPEDYQRALQLA